MNKDQIFMDAIKGSRKDITREFISKIISEDKTNTIRKYLASYGITQLAIHMQELGRIANPPKLLNVKISDEADTNQKRVQEGKVRPRRKATKSGIFDMPKLSYTKSYHAYSSSGTVTAYATDANGNLLVDANDNPIPVNPPPKATNDILYGNKYGPISKNAALNHLKTVVKNSVAAKKKPLAVAPEESVAVDIKTSHTFDYGVPSWLKDSYDETFEPEI